MIKLNTKSLIGLVTGLVIAISLVSVAPALALTAADIDLLVAMGIVSADKAAAAKAALGTTQYANLTVGSKGAEVTALQQMLVAGGFLKMPAGVAYGYYGKLTADAYAAYKAAQIVTPVNPGTTPGSLEGSDGELVTFKEFTSGIESVVAEDSEEKVLGVELEAGDDSDLKVTSMKLTLQNTTTSLKGSTRLDRYVDTVSIMQDSKEVASIEADDFSKSGTTYSKSISLSDAIVKAGEKSKFYVIVKTVSSIDSASDRNDTWTVTATQVRVTDATGAVVTELPDTTIAAGFSFEAVTANDEIKLLSASNNPSASNLKVDEDTDSDEYLALSFKLKADADSSDLNILSIPVAVQITSASTTSFNSDELISDIWLEVGGETYDDFDNTVIAVATTSATTTTYTFDIDEGDLTIGAGDTEEVKVFVKFGAQDGAYEVGTKIKLSVAGSDIDVENTDGDSVASPTNTANGNEQTLLLEGVQFNLSGVSTDTSHAVSDVASYVTFTMPLKITSDETLYILKSNNNVDTVSAFGYATTTSASSTVAAEFDLTKTTASVITSGTKEYYEIDASDTIALKFTVNGAKSGTIKSVGIVLNTVAAATELDGSTVTYSLSPATSFKVSTNLLTN